MRYRYTKLKGKDFFIALLHHLVINQVSPQVTLFSHNDDEKMNAFIFSPELAVNDLLIDLLKIYQNGLQHPAAFFTEASFAYLKAKKDGLKAAKTILNNALEQDYEVELQRLFDEETIERALDNGDFETQCEKFYRFGMHWLPNESFDF